MSVFEDRESGSVAAVGASGDWHLKLLGCSVLVLLCGAVPALAQVSDREEPPIRIKSITVREEGKPARTVEIENLRPSVAPDALATLSSVDVRDLSGIWVIEQDSRAGRVLIHDRQLRMRSGGDGSFVAEFVNGTNCPTGSGQRTNYIRGNLSGNLLSGSIQLCPSAAFITKCGDESVYTTGFQAELRDANTVEGRYRTPGYRIEAGGCVEDSSYDEDYTFLLERQAPDDCAAFGIACLDRDQGYPGFASNELLIPGVTLANPPPPDESTGRVFNLFIHGRAGGDDLCNEPATDFDQDDPVWSDDRGYWGPRWSVISPTAAGVPNTRYIGWNTEAPGGAFSTSSSCSAQTRVLIALMTFCLEPDSCNIYAHSTGGLVVPAYFADNEWAARYFDINRVQLMASAAGGSELAKYSHHVNFLSPELDWSVRPQTARNHFNHNAAGGLTYFTTSNLTYSGNGLFGNSLLPGLDDWVLANHTLCNLNTVVAVTVPCKRGGGSMKFLTICKTKNWGVPYACWYTYSRWEPYETIYAGRYSLLVSLDLGGISAAHAQAMEHYAISGGGGEEGDLPPGLRDPLGTDKGLPKPEALPPENEDR